MIRITITEAAFAAIASTLEGAAAAKQQSEVGAGRFDRAPDGMVATFLPEEAVARLRAMRGPGESYSDVILRLAQVDE